MLRRSGCWNWRHTAGVLVWHMTLEGQNKQLIRARNTWLAINEFNQLASKAGSEVITTAKTLRFRFSPKFQRFQQGDNGGWRGCGECHCPLIFILGYWAISEFVFKSSSVSGLGPPPPPGPTPFLVYLLTILAVIGAFLFGYDCGVVAGAVVIIKNVWFDVDDLWQSLIISVTVAAAAVFSLVAAPANEKFGRKKVILAASVLFVIGAVICGAAPNKEVLLVGRIVIGMGIGET